MQNYDLVVVQLTPEGDADNIALEIVANLPGVLSATPAFADGFGRIVQDEEATVGTPAEAMYPMDAPCVLCGESLEGEEDKGEMYGPAKPRFGNDRYGFVRRGLVHAQCGLDHGWEVA